MHWRLDLQHPVAAAAVCDCAGTFAVAAVAAEEQRWEFMLVVAPLRVPGGTGSPVNPLAIF